MSELSLPATLPNGAVTVRRLFYTLVAAGVIKNTQIEYQRLMREAGDAVHIVDDAVYIRLN